MFERLIAYQAQHTPQGLAIASAWDRFTYRQMADDIVRASAWAADLKLAWGARVLIDVPHPYLHWVLTFGLESAGVISAASSPTRAITDDLIALSAVALFARNPPDNALGLPVHRIDQAWLDGLQSYSPSWAGDRLRRGEDGFRIIMTSGTTGAAKKILLTRAMMDRRVAETAVARIFAPGDGLRATTDIGVGSIAGLQLAFACWVRGGTLCSHDPRGTWAKTLKDLAINGLMTSPYHLQVLLRELPEDFTLDNDLIVVIAGGSLSKPLAAECARRLTREVFVTYGSTETGGVTLGHIDRLEGAEDSAGYLNPWARVEVLDEQGFPLPRGKIGEVRIGGDQLVAGYLDDPAGTAEHFKDGWFYSRDLGVLSPEGRLQVLGRVDDLMNVGGAKMVASRLETAALHVPGVLDAAAFVAPDEQGLDAPHIAYVGDPDIAPLAAIFRDRLGRTPRLMRLEAIPRNPMGKIQRNTLRDLVVAAAATAAGGG